MKHGLDRQNRTHIVFIAVFVILKAVQLIFMLTAA